VNWSEKYVDKFHGVEELDIAPDEALQLLRPLYGLADSGDHWWREFNDHCSGTKT
jgi:hypothetical protein